MYLVTCLCFFYRDILVRVPFYKYHEFGKNPTTLDEDRAETDASRIGTDICSIIYGYIWKTVTDVCLDF
jgi:hypothetical protein